MTKVGGQQTLLAIKNLWSRFGRSSLKYGFESFRLGKGIASRGT
jgi:hypothetical protein